MLHKVKLFYYLIYFSNHGIVGYFQAIENKKFIKNSKIFDCFINSKHELIYRRYD